MTATPPIHLEVADIDRHHFTAPPFLAHDDEARVGQIHRLMGMLANQFLDTSLMLAQVPWAPRQAIGHGRQDRPEGEAAKPSRTASL